MKNKTYKKLAKKAICYGDIIADHIFVDHQHTRSLDDVCERIVRYKPVIRRLRDIVELNLRRAHKRSVFVNENGVKYKPVFVSDNRTGDETYGYESLESIEGDLEYISDRFLAAFRLTWLLEVPEKVALLKANR